MKINILTLFPEMFDIFNHSIIGKAQDKGIIDIEAVNIRDYTNNKHKKLMITLMEVELEWLCKLSQYWCHKSM